MNVKPVKTAVFGCGAISNAYLQSMTNRFQILDVVGCYDRHPEKVAEKVEQYHIAPLTLEQILQDDSIELVVNLTQSVAHYETNMQFLQRGKHVYTEKILAPELELARRQVTLAQEQKLYLGVAPDTFLGSALQTARYVVESGMIGDVTSCYAALSRDYLSSAARHPAALTKGWGIAFDVGIYYVTALLSILGPVTAVTGIMDTKHRTGTHQGIAHLGEPYTMECENIMAGTIAFANGAVGNLLFDSNSCMTVPERPGLTIYGTMGIVYLPDPNRFDGAVRVLLKGNNEPFTMQSAHPFEGECRGLGAAELAWALRQNRPNRASGEMAYHALEVLHGIAVSGERRTWYDMTSTFQLMPPLPRGFRSAPGNPASEESALAL